MASALEETLARQLQLCGVPEPEREYRFDAVRHWRFDFAWPDHKLAVECEGGVWTRGRHTRGGGFVADLKKYNEATLQGWRVLRYHAESIETGAALTQIETALGLVREAHDDLPF